MKYINYEIKNIEPIKLTSTIMQGDNEFTKSFISGSNLRGAFIANYISKTGVKDINKGEHKEKLLAGGLKFLNAYPVLEGVKTLPFPKCYYASKDGIKTISKTKSLEIASLENIDKEDIAFDKVKAFEFVKWDKENLEFNPIVLEKVGNLHIRKGFENENKLFRYEAIKEGQIFKASIVCKDDETATEVSSILEKGIFYVGGSKGSGYGLCEISNVTIEDRVDEMNFIEDKSISNEITIVATSDILYRDEKGEYKSYISKKALEKEFSITNVSLKKSFVDTDYFTGYNNKWGYRIPKVLGIKAGSVFTYTFDGTIENKDLVSFINKGIGARKSEGFGRILILDNLNFNKVALKDKKEAKRKIKLNKTEEVQMKLVVDRIYRETLKGELSKNVLKLNGNLKGGSKIKTAQWGKLYRMMFLLEGMSRQEGTKKLDKYFQNINDKKLNRDLANAFQHIKIDEEKLQEFILRDLNDLNEKTFCKTYAKAIKIAGVVSSISDDEIYRYKVNMFKEFFRLQLKDSERGK